MIDSTSSGRTSQKSTHTVSPKIKIKKKKGERKRKKVNPAGIEKKKKKAVKSLMVKKEGNTLDQF